MADYLFPTTGQRSEYTPGTAEKMRALERRQKIAAALIEQGAQPKQVRQAGRFVVAPSMMEQLSGPMTALAGVLSSAYLDKEREGIQEAETAKVAKAMQDYAAAQEDVPEWRGRTVPGTGRPEVVGQPSNLEDILQASSPQEPTIPLRKPTAEVADAVFARQQPQQFQVSPEFDGPAAQFAAYRPGVQGAAAVPDRRETVDEALNRVGGEGTAQGVKEGWIDPGPIVRPDLAAAASEANRPDQAARPRTPAELRAADMALMASGVPNAWPIVHLASQQREADKARAETLAQRQAEALQTKQRDLLAHEDRVLQLDGILKDKSLARADRDKWEQQKAETQRNHDKLMAELAQGRIDALAAQNNATQEQLQSAADLILAGEAPAPTGRSLTSKNGLEIMAIVHAAKSATGKPLYDPTHYATRQGTMKDFTSGVSSKALASLVTVGDHMDTFAAIQASLDKGDIRAANLLSNIVGNAFDKPEVASAEMATALLGKELATAIAGQGSTALADRQELENILSINRGPKQMESLVRFGKKFIYGRVKGLKAKYENGTKDDDFYQRFNLPPFVTELAAGEKTPQEQARLNAARAALAGGK